jgi:hypothetical protein
MQAVTAFCLSTDEDGCWPVGLVLVGPAVSVASASMRCMPCPHDRDLSNSPVRIRSGSIHW